MRNCLNQAEEKVSARQVLAEITFCPHASSASCTCITGGVPKNMIHSFKGRPLVGEIPSCHIEVRHLLDDTLKNDDERLAAILSHIPVRTASTVAV